MKIIKTVLGQFKSLALFEWMSGYRGQAGSLLLIYSGLFGLIFGSIPIPTGSEGVIWTDVSPEMSFASLTAGLSLLGIRLAKGGGAK